MLDRLRGRFLVQSHVATQERGGIESSQDELSIGYRWFLAARPVADGTGISTGAVGTDTEQPSFVYPCDASSTCAYLADINHGYPERNTPLQLSLGSVPGDSAVDQAHLERSASHIDGDEILDAEGIRHLRG